MRIALDVRDHPAVAVREEPRITFEIHVAVVAHRPRADGAAAGLGGELAEIDLADARETIYDIFEFEVGRSMAS
ncbi:MAG: hypothetical protein ACXWI7_04860 [Croceibacterium sp.]